MKGATAGTLLLEPVNIVGEQVGDFAGKGSELGEELGSLPGPGFLVVSTDLLDLGLRVGDTVGARVGLRVGLGVVLVTTGLGLGWLTGAGLLMGRGTGLLVGRGTRSGQISKRNPVTSQYVDGMSVVSIPVLLKVKTSRVGMSPIADIQRGRG